MNLLQCGLLLLLLLAFLERGQLANGRAGGREGGRGRESDKERGERWRARESGGDKGVRVNSGSESERQRRRGGEGGRGRERGRGIFPTMQGGM